METLRYSRHSQDNVNLFAPTTIHYDSLWPIGEKLCSTNGASFGKLRFDTGSSVWITFVFRGEWLMSSQFQRLDHPPQWPITDQFFWHIYCPSYLNVWLRFEVGSLWNAEMCFQLPRSLIGKVLTLVMTFCVRHTPYGLRSALETGQEARVVQIDFSAAFNIVNGQGMVDPSGSTLWEVEVLCCLFGHSFSLIDHSMPWWMVAGANWWRWCQECLREVWVRNCPSCNGARSVSQQLKTNFTIMLTTQLWLALCHSKVRE